MKVLNKEKLVKAIVEMEGLEDGVRYTARKCAENTKSFSLPDDNKTTKIVMGMNEYTVMYNFFRKEVENCTIDVEDTEENIEKYTKLGYVLETEVAEAHSKKKK